MNSNHIVIELLKTSNSETLKIAIGKKMHYTQRDEDKRDGIFLIRNNAIKKTVKLHL